VDGLSQLWMGAFALEAVEGCGDNKHLPSGEVDRKRAYRFVPLHKIE